MQLKQLWLCIAPRLETISNLPMAEVISLNRVMEQVRISGVPALKTLRLSTQPRPDPLPMGDYEIEC